MNAEKQVKQQARAALKGNWSTVIAAAGVTFAAFTLVEIVSSLLLIAFQDIDFETGEILNTENWIYIGIVLGSSVVLLFLSPLFNGFLKTAANVAAK